MNTVSKQPISVKVMHISIADNTKNRFHAACAIRGLIRSQVVVELIEQWLKACDTSTSDVVSGEFVTRGKLACYSDRAIHQLLETATTILKSY